MAISTINRRIDKKVALGIDIGTSYIKGALINIDGLIVSTFRKKASINIDTASDLILASIWWSDIKSVISGLILNCNNQNNIVGICVSAISPTLTVFDAKNPNEAYSILYSSLSKKDIGTNQYCHLLTRERLTILRDVATQKQFIKPYITDLVGYINYRLTGELTINSISLSCIGATENTFDNHFLCVEDNTFPKIVSVIEDIGKITEGCSNELGIDIGISVCGGCPDVMGSVIGCGMQYTTDRMIYLGTFGSLLKIEQKIDDLLESKIIKKQPFNFLLSVPEFGNKIETLSKQWFQDSPKILVEKANKIVPCAEGTIFLLPRWKDGMVTVGSYEFIPNTIDDLNIKARAVVESVAFAVRLIEEQLSNDVYVCGGGSQSHLWLDIISIVLQNNVKSLDYSWESAGTADIAGRMYWGNINNKRSLYISKTEYSKFKEIINENYYKIKKCYNDRNWF